MTSKQTLAFYVEDFKNWRRDNYTDEQISVNNCDDPSYPQWDKLEDLFSDLLVAKQISQLDREDKINLLYLIARGWDNAAFLSELSENRPISSYGDLTDKDFIELAEIAVTLSGAEYDDAKSSIAICFRKFDYTSQEIESILLKLYEDKELYTKRQALISLAKLGYKDITRLIKKSWLLDDEWVKIGCLSILNEYVNDEKILREYLAEACIDSRKDLSQYANELEEKNNC